MTLCAVIASRGRHRRQWTAFLGLERRSCADPDGGGDTANVMATASTTVAADVITNVITPSSFDSPSSAHGYPSRTQPRSRPTSSDVRYRGCRHGPAFGEQPLRR